MMSAKREPRAGARWMSLGVALFVACLAGSAAAQRTIGVQPKAGGAVAESGYGESWAVVIGINDYRHARIDKLRYAVNDARSVQRALVKLGWKPERIVTLLDREATKAAIERTLGDRLRRDVRPADRVLVFFAGHGVTDKRVSGEEEGYLLAADTDPGALYGTGISMDSLRNIPSRVNARHILFVLDACFSGYSITRGVRSELFEDMMRRKAVQVVTAGTKDQVVEERDGHGIFTQVFLRALEDGAAFPRGKNWLALDELGIWVRDKVHAETGGRQEPRFSNTYGDGQFVFFRPGAGGLGAVVAGVPPPPLEGREEIRQEFGSLAISARLPGVDVWVGDQKVWTSRAGADYVMPNVPVGTHRITGRKDGRKWSRDVPVAANQRAEVVIDIEPLRPESVSSPRTEDGGEMVLVSAGEFTMGSNDDDREKPPHRVYLDGFHIDKYEVTNARYRRFMAATSRAAPLYYWKDEKWNGASQPVVSVSWDDADAYCKWAGKRLPTEAEWEKAARGTDGRTYPWGEQWDASRANSIEGRLLKTVPVGSYASGVSPYGAHDMTGNVAEWVADWYDKDYYKQSPERNPQGPISGTDRVNRGGSWLELPVHLRTSQRLGHSPDFRANFLGFRCARGL